MEKIENNESKISLKDVINWIIILLVPVIPSIITRLFDSNKDNDILTKVFLVSLITSSFITFIWIKIFSSKKNDKLVNRLIKEIETKKDLENELRGVKNSLKRTENSYSYEKKSNENLKKENTKFENERDQLEIVLSRCGIRQKEVGIDGNIPFYEWEKKPGIKEKIEEITQKDYKEWREAEHIIFNLSGQLEENKVPWWEQKLGDKRWKEKVINSVEGHWKYRSHIKADTNNEIEGKTIEEILTKHWREHLQSKKGKEIIEEGRRFIKLIDDFTSKHLRKIN